MYISVSLATCLRFSRVGQFSCFRALLVTHPSFSVFVLVTKRAALCWTCSSHDVICSMLYMDPIQYNHYIPTLVSLAICSLKLYPFVSDDASSS